ncbi:MAG: RNA polymerase sigma-70 factor (family 1) [Arenicella sp.]
MDQERLIKKFIKGNKRAFDTIYAKYCDAMYNICMRYTKNQDEAADILQDAFIKIYEKRELFDPQYSIGAWIKRIVMNEAINHYRVNKKFELVEDDSFFEQEDEVIEVVDNTNLKEKLTKTIDSLPPGYQAVFKMYVIENLTHKEIAQYLDISENTSKTQLSKARRMLKTKLEELQITRSTIEQ